MNNRSNNFAYIDDFLRTCDEVAIFSHIHPDGDTIGSQVAFAQALMQAGVRVQLFNTTPVDEQFDFLNADIKQYDDGSALPSVVIFLDCHSNDRVGIPEEYIKGKTLVALDHHQHEMDLSSNPLFFIDPDAPATCEIVMSYLLENNYDITPDIATALYLGLSTDTGSFMYESVTSKTLQYASILLDNGADFNKVRLNIYENTSMAKFALLKHLYSQVEFFAHDKAGICTFTYELQKELNTSDADFEGLANIIKEVSGVEVGIVAKELEDGQTKISFRGKKSLPLHEIAAHFGGGGHERAAGARINLPLKQAASAVRDYVEKEILKRNDI